MEKQHSKTLTIVRYAICLALMVVCSQITVPLPFTAVPVTLALFMVFLIGALMGPIKGTLCMLLYILMGAIGLPVFAGFNSFSALAGPTAGYIFGYVPMVAIVGAFARFKPPVRLIGMVLGLIACYMCGTLWFAYVSGVEVIQSLMLTVVPFIAADAFKMIAAFLVASRLNKVLHF